MKTFTCAQGSPEWFALRLGVVTASEADAILTPHFKARTGEGVETYLYRKLAEKVMGYSPDSLSTFNMDQGSMAERIALPWFNFTYNTDAKPVGFCLSDDGKTGCSPDALIGDDCGLEIKFPAPPTHLKYYFNNVLPPEYAVQVHFSMYVTNRPRWVFLSYSQHFPSLVVHVERDDAIQSKIADAVGVFLERYSGLLQALQKIKDAENAAAQAAYDERVKKGLT